MWQELAKDWQEEVAGLRLVGEVTRHPRAPSPFPPAPRILGGNPGASRGSREYLLSRHAVEG